MIIVGLLVGIKKVVFERVAVDKYCTNLIYSYTKVFKLHGNITMVFNSKTNVYCTTHSNNSKVQYL